MLLFSHRCLLVLPVIDSTHMGANSPTGRSIHTGIRSCNIRRDGARATPALAARDVHVHATHDVHDLDHGPLRELRLES